MRSLSAIAMLFVLPLLPQPAAAQSKAERLYVIECGSRTAPDVSPWTPGVNVGKPVEFVDTCYVIKHGNERMVWDTGLPDAIFSKPSTDPNTWRRSNTLADELDKIGIKPSNVKYLAVSHTRPDHIGNVELFPQALLLVQQAEYDWPNQDGSPRFNPSHPVAKLQGDHDVFSDGSVMIHRHRGTRQGISPCWSSCLRLVPRCCPVTRSTARTTGTPNEFPPSTPTKRIVRLNAAHGRGDGR
jgi:N-acyl homoserine lactone hydrolase